MSSSMDLTNVHESNLSFKEIFTIYDDQFSRIRDYILALGGEVPPGGSGSTTLLLDKFGVSGDSIEVESDVFLDLKNTANEVISRVKEIKDLRDEIFSVSYTYEEYDQRLQQKINEYNSKKYQLEDLLADLYTKYTDATKKFATIDSLSTVISAYRQEVVDIRDSIVGISGLSPVELEDREVYLARNGASTLGTRLNSMTYSFSSISDMRSCYFLKTGDICITLPGPKVFDIKTSVPSGTLESYTIGSTGLYACLKEEVVSYQSNRTKVFFTECSVTPDLLESGNGVTSVTVKWNTNTIPKAVSVKIGSTTYNLDALNTGTSTLSCNVMGNTNVVFSCKSWDDTTSSKTLPISFIPCIYYGVKNLTELDSVDLSGCTKILDSKGSFTSNVASGKYLYVFIPPSVSGSLYIDGIAGGYEFLGNKSLANGFSYSLSYKVYRTTNSNLGSVFVEVR